MCAKVRYILSFFAGSCFISLLCQIDKVVVTPSGANKLKAAQYLLHDEEEEFRCFRVKCPSIAARLIHPAFGIFRESFNHEVRDRGIMDDQMFKYYINRLKTILPTEDTRRSLLFNLIFSYLQYGKFDKHLLETTAEEKNVDVSVVQYGAHLPLLLCEVKNEAGTSGDVHITQLMSHVKDFYFKAIAASVEVETDCVLSDNKQLLKKSYSFRKI